MHTKVSKLGDAGPLRGRGAAVALAIGIIGVAMRLSNAATYPLDWGFDGSEIWRYIMFQSQEFQLPAPDALANASDPPGFYVAAALVYRALSPVDPLDNIVMVFPLLGTIAGLAIVALAALLILRLDPGDRPRALLGAGLLLYLPAHIQMCAMVNEEIWVAALISAAVYLLATRRSEDLTRSGGLRRTAAIGLACGLALLVKLTGILAAFAAAGTYALAGIRQRANRALLARVAIVALLSFAIGGWFFARNQLLYGAFHPHGLPQHQFMFSMPPGSRSLSDFVHLPLATFWDPQLLNADLLHSVWGSIYATVWFDGHRFFLPRESMAVTWLGRITLVLSLLPTSAFVVGAARGIRRARATVDGPDVPLLLVSGLLLCGCAFYALQNPWFTSVKGTYLLGMSLPFAFYASEVIAAWCRRSRGLAIAISIALGALCVCVVIGNTFGLVFEKTELPGLEWR